MPTEADLEAQFAAFPPEDQSRLEKLAFLQNELEDLLGDRDERFVVRIARNYNRVSFAIATLAIALAMALAAAAFSGVSRAATAIVFHSAKAFEPLLTAFAIALALIVAIAWGAATGALNPAVRRDVDVLRLAKKTALLRRELPKTLTRFTIIAHVRRLCSAVRVERPPQRYELVIAQEMRLRILEEARDRKRSALINLGLALILIGALGVVVYTFITDDTVSKLVGDHGEILLIARSVVTLALSALIFFFLWTYRLHHTEAKHFANEANTVDLRLIGWTDFQNLWSPNSDRIPDMARPDIWRAYANVSSELAKAERNVHFKTGEHNQATRQLHSESKWFQWLKDMMPARK